MDSVRILKTEMSITNIDDVAQKLLTKQNYSVAICNANTLVRCYKNIRLNKIINSFDIKCTDGFPVAKASKILYKNNQKRVDGYKLFLKTIEKGLEHDVSHYFFGNSETVVLKMIDNIKLIHPKVNIKGFTCPPLSDYKELAKQKFISDIMIKKPDILWVSLGFPKQEKFINLIKKNNELQINMVGIGAVFEWVAGTKLKAPEWVANIGFEWVLRLIQEPKRLLRRYFVDNFLFIIYFIKQYIKK